MPQLVLVAGATGNLGAAVVAELVSRGADVRALVRPDKADGGDSLRDLVSAGKVTAVVGDLADDVSTLARHLERVDVVVSAVQGGAKVVTDGQVNLLRAAERTGVPRMIPSDFSVDLHRLDYGDVMPLDLRKKADEAFVGSPVRRNSVLIGGFYEVMHEPFMQIVDLNNDTFSYWGDGDQPMDLTSIPDCAAYTAAVALNDSAGAVSAFAGEVVTMKQWHAAVEAGTGRTFKVRELGSIADLEAEIARRKETADDASEWVALQYQWAMAGGKAKLGYLRNRDYPDISPSTIAQFVAR
jgi:nucleoside-diphosphate-sugar epimerase